MNKAYNKGRRKEYKICNQLKESGFDIVQRSAGSHSPVDVFAIKKLDNKILLVQSKPESMSDKNKEKLEVMYQWLNGSFDVRFKVI